MQNVMINDVNVPVIEMNGERVMKLSDVDRVHGRKRGTASARFNSNKSRFVLGKDYYQVTMKELMAGNVIKGRPNIKVNLITKSGYLMLVKMFNDDTAWEVQRRLVDFYFETQKKEVAAKNGNEEVLLAIINTLKETVEMQNKLVASINDLANTVASLKAKVEEPKIEAKVETPKVEVPKVEVKAPSTKITRRNIDRSLVPEEYKKWKKDLVAMLDGYDRNAVIKVACNKLHQVYGVSWADERTNFLRENDRFPVDGNLELAFNLEQKPNWQNIFVNTVCDIAGEFEKIEIPYHYPAESMNDVKGIVRTVAKKRNDPSVYGNHMYNHIISCFKKETGFDMKEADQKFREAKGYGNHTRVKRTEVIDFVCKEQFLNWFNPFVEREYGKEVVQ